MTVLMPDRAKLVTAPDGYPVTLAEAKAQLAFGTTVDDTLFYQYLQAATLEAQRYTGRRLVRQTYDIYCDCWPGDNVFELPFGWLSSVTGVYYTDTAGTENTLASTVYDVKIEHILGRVSLAYNQSWPTTELDPWSAIRIRFVCGRVTADERAVSTAYAEDDFALPLRSSSTGLVYTVTTAGTSSTDTTLDWALTIGQTTGDNGIVWEADSEVIPEEIRLAILITVADSYEWREDKVVTQGAQLLNLDRFRRLLRPWRLPYVWGM